jgi:exodeoxyribonuclease V alpha subunit
MIMENDYGLNLYNGDIGIILPQADVSGVVRAKVAFIGSDGAVRWIQPSRLPKHETVFAMTVHKSQGSEFNHCALVLPDYHASVVTKELIYTGITRAKKQLTLIGRESVIKSGLKSKVQRFSGLRDRLWSQDDPSPVVAKPTEETGALPEQISLF